MLTLQGSPASVRVQWNSCILEYVDLSQFNEVGFEKSLKLAACLQVLLFFC